tara:strand:+ start:11136 stop:11339 length:204 start_codon:yes stop_codon:yes gene_type:complete
MNGEHSEDLRKESSEMKFRKQRFKRVKLDKDPENLKEYSAEYERVMGNQRCGGVDCGFREWRRRCLD